MCYWSECTIDSLLDEPTPSKSSQSTPSTPDSSLQDMIKAMNNQLASLASQFEEFKCSDKPSAFHKSLPVSQEQGMCPPASQSRPDPSEGELSVCESIPYLLGSVTDLGLLKARQIHINRSWTPLR